MTAGDSSASMPHEGALLHAIRAGDLSAFSTLYHQHYQGLWRFAYGLLKNRETAEETVQDVFAMLWERRQTLEIHTGLTGYLYGAIRNHALNHVRHARVESRETEIMQSGGELLGGSEQSPLPDTIVETQAFFDALDAAIAALPETRRTAATLRWRVGLSYPEIGEILGISPDAARVAVARTRTALARALRPFAE